MRIAIDYDDTYTRDPPMWDKVVAIMLANGHEVFCVTSRRSTFENIEEINDALQLISEQDRGVKIVCCNYNAKAEVMQKRHIPVDIWIDDNPKTIDPDGVIKKPQYDKWKESGK